MGFVLSWSHHVLDLSEKTHVMGVLNVTPDSFSDGGRYLQADRAVAHGLSLVEEGADILDVGGESTRPYSRSISAEEEVDRVVPVIEALAREVSVPISIDTCKAAVAQEALRAGASIINDISSLRFDPEIAAVAARAGVPLILMHMKGTPADMQVMPVYEDLIGEISSFLSESVEKAVFSGVRKDLILIDPGIGFGKSFEDNLLILRELARFSSLRHPILIGTSNKSFIGRILGKEVHERVIGTMATVAAAVLNGAHIVRVHDVSKSVETVRVIDAIKGKWRGQWGREMPVFDRG